MRLTLRDPAATEAFARQVAERLPKDLSGWTLLLEGDLGAGKSTFARAFIRALGHDAAVPSPTYTLIEPYRLRRGQIYHIDLYRIGSEDELHYLGFSDLDDGCRIIEWAERAPGLTAAADLLLRLRYDGDGRLAELEALSPRGEDVVARMPVNHNT